MDTNDPLSKNNKFPLGHKRPMSPFTPKSTSRLKSIVNFRYLIVIPYC